MFFSSTLFIAMLTSRILFFLKKARICECDENMGMWIQVILCLINCERSGWNECYPCGYIINKKISFLEKEVIPCSNESLPGSVYYFHKTTGWNGTVLEWLDRVPRGLNGFIFTQIHRSLKSAQKGLQDACGEKYLLLGEFEAVSGHWALLTELFSLGFIGLLLRIQNSDGLKRCNLDYNPRLRNRANKASKVLTHPSSNQREGEDGRLSWPVTKGEL